MNHRGWVLWLFLMTACGGRSRADGSSSSSAAQAGAAGAGNAGASDAGAGGAPGCPDNLASTEPTEGAVCAVPGMSCQGYGTLSCPLTAVCSADSKWQIHCPSTMAFGPCSCPHAD